MPALPQYALLELPADGAIVVEPADPRDRPYTPRVHHKGTAEEIATAALALTAAADVRATRCAQCSDVLVALGDDTACPTCDGLAVARS